MGYNCCNPSPFQYPPVFQGKGLANTQDLVCVDFMRTDLPLPIYYIGTSGWTYDHWKGRFYPEGLPKNRWFDFYSSHFPAVEVNATFYRAFKDQTYLNWRMRAPEDFGYVLKAPRIISHRKYLLDVEQEIKAFYRSCRLLADRFEMILLQVAPGTPYDLGRLKAALLAFPDPGSVAVEFRHPRWLNPEVEALLRALGVTYCNVDSPRQKLTDILTTDRAYLRLHGRKHWYAYDYLPGELEEIAALARRLAERGASRVYVFFNNDFEGYAPANAMTLLEMLRAS
jgi:uncharacterized protein YecE (DUF72 family)